MVQSTFPLVNGIIAAMLETVVPQMPNCRSHPRPFSTPALQTAQPHGQRATAEQALITSTNADSTGKYHDFPLVQNKKKSPGSFHFLFKMQNMNHSQPIQEAKSKIFMLSISCIAQFQCTVRKVSTETSQKVMTQTSRIFFQCSSAFTAAL